MNKNLVSRCGLYCGFCSIYRAYKDSEKLQEELAKKYNCLPEEVKCEGCQALDIIAWSHETKWGTNCVILKCLNTKKLKFCYECTEYNQCQKFDEMARLCSGIGVDLRANLRMISEGKTEKWLLEQDKKWRCPKCNNPIINSDDFKSYHWCGNRLRG